MPELKNSIAISASGLKAQSTRMRVVAENIANAGVTSEAAGGDPYRRKTITFRNILDKQTGAMKVQVSKIGTAPGDFTMKYEPSHPAANETGYVKYPNVNPLLEAQDMRESERSYEANLAAIQTAKTMIDRTLQLMQ